MIIKEKSYSVEPVTLASWIWWRNWLKNTRLTQKVSMFTVSQYASIIMYHLCCADVRDEDNKSPLYLACEGGHKRVVEYLVEKANCAVSE